MDETASTPSASRSDSCFLGTPIAQVQKVVTHGAVGELGDGWQDALEVVAADALDHGVHKILGKARLDAILGGVALVHQKIQELVHLGVGKSQLALVGLAFPQVGGGRLLDDLLGD